MTDIAVDTLRIRGPHARRLAGIAARALPAALERALSDVDDVAADSVSVRLEIDVDGCDDDTLAALWAEAIRARVLATARGSRRPPARTPASAEPAPVPRLEAAQVLAAARAWLARGAERSGALPRALLALGDGQTAQAVAAAARPDEWAALLDALSLALQGSRPLSIVDDLTVPDAAAHFTQIRSAPADAATIDAQEVAPPSSAPGPTAAPEIQAAQGEAILDAVARLAGLVAVGSLEVDLSAVTRAAGLVLLYPWLAEHCRRAQELHPDLNPVDVREAALAAIADPENPGLADDPLVRLLAGRPLPWPTEPGPRRPLPRLAAVLDSATGVLASFAALLPGFERSTPGYVRACWIVRLGLLDAQRNPALLLAAVHPLDVMLPRLPYPVGLLKLPWSPPVSVRFRS